MLACLATGIALASCGSSSDAEDDQDALAFTVTHGYEASSFTGPTEVSAGLHTIELENVGELEADLQLTRVEGERPMVSIIKAFEKGTEIQAVPDWFTYVGGVGSTIPEETNTVTQELEPGSYYAFNTKVGLGIGLPSEESVLAFEVTDDESGESAQALPKTTGRLTVFEYGIKAEGITSGNQKVLFENTGTEPHHVFFSPLLGNNTAKDVERFFADPEGSTAPFEEAGTRSTVTIEGGEKQVIALGLQPGRYVMVCYARDRSGGRSHASRGSVAEITVK